MDDIVNRLFSGDRRAMARLMTLAENGAPRAKKLLAEIYPKTGTAHIIGITGPPGAGKSTLVDKLTLEFRKRGKTIGIIAVDPTSPFTGGALLGDRIRMNEVCLDPDVFIRSMGTRGSLGGLARATNDLVKILDAFGKDVILIETVGAGQSEVDIVKTAHTTIVIGVPGMGDDIQAIKAGILEIGDIFVVNKADHDGADRTVLELQAMLELNQAMGEWMPPVQKAVAKKGEGITELADSIQRHVDHLRNNDLWDHVVFQRSKAEFLEIVKDDIKKYIVDRAIEQGTLDELVQRIAHREIDPYSASEALLEPLRKSVDSE